MIYTEEEIQEYLTKVRHDPKCGYYGYPAAQGDGPGAFKNTVDESELID
jgi:hypothetical protein